MGVAYIGPVALDLFDPSFSWVSAPSAAGTRQASLNGTVDWAIAHQLSELVANPDRNLTVGGDSGVLEYVWSSDSMLRAFNGWYLLKQCNVSPAREHSLGGDRAVVPVAISAVHLGERQVAIVRSARARTNVHSLPAYELLAAPLTVSESSEAFIVEPGGDEVLREFDAEHGSPFGPASDPRTMQLRRAAVDTLPAIVLPTVETIGHPPAWLTARGGDCRVYDTFEGREVYGPSHPIAEPSDVVLCNGLSRWWVGGSGVVPYLTAMAMADGDWVQAGHVLLADETTGPVVDGARLITVTPDVVTVALRVRTLGEIIVSLRRGERMLRVQHGSTRAPAVSVARRIDWRGLPPTVGGLSGASLDSNGEFGSGLDIDDGTIEFQLPHGVTQDGWAFRRAWIPADDSTTQAAAGLLMVADVDGQGVIVSWYDDQDQTIHVSNGAGEVQSSPLTFEAGDVVAIAAGFAPSIGLVLAWSTPDGTVGSTRDATVTTPWSDSQLDLLTFHAYTPWGAGTWGSGEWGGHLDGSGVADEVMLFRSGVTATQAEALVSQVAQLENVPAGAAWYASFDRVLEPTASTVSTGRRVESSAEFNGLRRMVGALVAVTDAGTMGIQATAEQVELMAGLRSSTVVGSGNTSAEMHDQFAAQSQQEVRIR